MRSSAQNLHQTVIFRGCIVTVGNIVWVVIVSYTVILTRTTNNLKININEAIIQIQPDFGGRVIEDWTIRIRATVKNRGRQFK